MRRIAIALCATCMILLSIVAPVGSQSAADTVFIIKDDNLAPSNADIALALAQQTTYSGSRVIISRDDEFADALASGLLQNDAPLLLLPTAGPVPTAVADEIAALGVNDAIILGGTAAVEEQVEGDLNDLGIATDRRAGGSRFDTAVAIAEADAPESDTLLLARAFPADGSTDASQAFADALAAGALSAREGWPVLLTHSDFLTGPTRDYIERSPATRVLILGGTAAISDAVESDVAALVPNVERVAGDSRADTAVEVAKVSGADTAQDVARVVLVEGQGENAWAGGFAAASHAASLDAPIVLASGSTLPPETEAFLSSGIGGDPDAGPVITCIVVPDLCETARVTSGLPPIDDTTPPEFEPISETFAVELADNMPAVVEFDVARGYFIGAEVVAVPPECGLYGIIYDPSREFSQFAYSDGLSYLYWSPFVAASAGGTWEIELACTAQTGPLVIEVAVETESDADVETLEIGAVQELTRGDPGSFRPFRVELMQDTSYVVEQSIVIGGATAHVVVLDPADALYAIQDCNSGTCTFPMTAPSTGTYTILGGSYGDDRLTYELSVQPGE